MRSSRVPFYLFIVIPAIAFAQDDPTSRYGKLSIQDQEQEFKHRLIVNDKPVYEYMGKSIEILDVLKGIGRDFVIVAAYSGGIACPAKVVIVELRASRRPKVSEEFGSCADSISYRLAGNSVTVDTPGYVPHPELVSKSWARRMARSVERFTWSNGKLSRRYVRIS